MVAVTLIIVKRKGINVTPEHELWSRVLILMVEDAMGLFKIPNEQDEKYGAPILKEQYKAIREEMIRTGQRVIKRETLHGSDQNKRNVPRARHFMETSQLDEMAAIIGYDSSFVNRTFALVQEAITLEKKLFEEFKV